MGGQYVTVCVDGREVGIVEEEDVEIAALLLEEEYARGGRGPKAIDNVKQELKKSGAPDLLAMGIAYAAKAKLDKERTP